MEMIKIHYGIRLENMALGTEFACNVCAGIGPLQHSVVLVLSYLIKCGVNNW